MGSLKVRFTDVNGNEQIVDDAAADMSLMEVAKANGIEGILADCGGACSCATCHVYIGDGWMDKVGQPDDIELSMLDMVADIMQDNSRLSCQIQMRLELDGLEVTVAPDVGF